MPQQLSLSLLLVVLAAPLGACSPPVAAAAAAEAAAPPRRVRTEAVIARKVAPPVRATGIVVAKEQGTLAFKVGGVVKDIRVQAGERVHAGQVLARLETPEIDAQVAQAEAALEKARRDQARAAQLVARQAAASQASDDAATALRLAEQTLTIARFNQRHAVVVATGEGRVARRLVEPHAVVAPGTPILQLNMAAAGYVVRAGLIDRDVVRLREGALAAVEIDAYPGRLWRARVTQIAEEPSPLSGVFDVELRLEELPPRLVTGLVAKVELAAADPPLVALVPIEALVEGSGQRAHVFVASAGRVDKRAVEVAFFTERAAAVSHGVVAGERVVTDGAAYLVSGADISEAP